MASANLRDGGDYRIEISPGGLFDCETGATLSVSRNMIDATCKGNVDGEGRPFKEFVPGTISYNLAVNLIIELGEAGVDVFDAITLLKEGTSLDFDVKKNSSNVFSGVGTINNVGIEANNNDSATASLTINGNGALTVA